LIYIAMASLLLIPVSAFGEEEWVLISDASYIDEFGFLHIVGEVQNNFTTSWEFVEIRATIYDASGTAVSIANGFADISVLRPAERSSFEVVLENADQSSKADNYRLLVNGEHAVIEKNAVLEVIEGDNFIDELGFYHVIGEIRNSGTATATAVEVSAALYDEQRKVLATVRGLAIPPDIAAGQSAAYELVATAPLAINTHSTSVNVESEEYANVVIPEFHIVTLVLISSIAGIIGLSTVLRTRRAIDC